MKLLQLVGVLILLASFLVSDPAFAQNPSNTVSIYTYRTVTTRLINETERLSNVALVQVDLAGARVDNEEGGE